MRLKLKHVEFSVLDARSAVIHNKKPAINLSVKAGFIMPGGVGGI